MKIKKAKGVLGRMLANIDELSLAKTRNRMIMAAKIAESIGGGCDCGLDLGGIQGMGLL